MKVPGVFLTALILALVTSNLLAVTVCSAAPRASIGAPIQIKSSSCEAQTLVMADIKQTPVPARKKFARVVAAAICTDDLATISFQEYPVDWSGWVTAVADRWSNVMNGSHSKSKPDLRPCGPMFVEFTCNRDGTISDVIIDRSSGDRMCDAVQVGTLLHCLPLPAFPSQSRKKNITLLCIWAYDHGGTVSKTAKRHTNTRKDIRVSITGASL